LFGSLEGSLSPLLHSVAVVLSPCRERSLFSVEPTSLIES
jgi:hypothetical protein